MGILRTEFAIKKIDSPTVHAYDEDLGITLCGIATDLKWEVVGKNYNTEPTCRSCRNILTKGYR